MKALSYVYVSLFILRGGLLVGGAAAADDDEEDDDDDAAPLLLLLMMMLLLQQLGLLLNAAGGAYGAQLGTTVRGPSAHFAVKAGSSACNFEIFWRFMNRFHRELTPRRMDSMLRSEARGDHANSSKRY